MVRDGYLTCVKPAEVVIRGSILWAQSNNWNCRLVKRVVDVSIGVLLYQWLVTVEASMDTFGQHRQISCR